MVEVLQIRLSDAQSFYDKIFDWLPNLLSLSITELGSDSPEYWSKWSFASDVILSFTIIGHKVFTVFIDCVISQVHKQIPKVTWLWAFVWNCSKPCKSFFVQENPQWIDTSKENIYSQIKFKAINQIWLMHVSLNHIMFSWKNVFEASGQEDAFSLARSLRFDNESFVPFGCNLSFIFFIVGR